MTVLDYDSTMCCSNITPLTKMATHSFESLFDNVIFQVSLDVNCITDTIIISEQARKKWTKNNMTKLHAKK